MARQSAFGLIWPLSKKFHNITDTIVHVTFMSDLFGKDVTV